KSRKPILPQLHDPAPRFAPKCKACQDSVESPRREISRNREYQTSRLSLRTDEHLTCREFFHPINACSLVLSSRIFPGGRRNQIAWRKAACRRNQLHHVTRTARTKQSLTPAPARLRRWPP